MFNSSLAHEMTAYIELRSAAFSNSLISNDKMALGLLDQYLIQTGFQGKNLTEEVLSAWAKTLSGKSKTVKEKLGELCMTKEIDSGVSYTYGLLYADGKYQIVDYNKSFGAIHFHCLLIT